MNVESVSDHNTKTRAGSLLIGANATVILSKEVRTIIIVGTEPVSIYRIGKISTADMAKFSILAIGTF